MDDFYIIAQENGQCSKDSIIDNTGTETQVKSLTKFLRNITGGTTASSNSVGSGTTTSSTSQMVNHVQLIILFDLSNVLPFRGVPTESELIFSLVYHFYTIYLSNLNHYIYIITLTL